MKQSGFRVKVQQEQSEDSITIKMVIPKQKKMILSKREQVTI